MKKFLFFIPLCLVLLLSSAFAEGAFPDLPASHWAYNDVEIMRQDGRVNGFPDGEFKPNELVTRWQFAKMAGGNPDIVEDGERASTREEAIEYLWKIAGSPIVYAPSAVTQGSKAKEAVSWGYTKGIMQGDDGFNLRLSSTLTRAEAAALIIRSEKPLNDINFKNSVSEVILKQVWDSMRTGIEYRENAGVTNGYVARIALRIANGGMEPDYRALNTEPYFEGAYAKDLQLVCQECLGIERATEAFMKAPVSQQDAMAMLTFYTMKQAFSSIKYDENLNYPDATLTTTYGEMALKVARYNEIFLYADGTLHADKVATIKDISCIILQLDEVFGLSRSYGDSHVTRFLKDAYNYPSNADDYAYVLDEIPVEVYETPIIQGVKTSVGFNIGNTFINTFTSYLSEISKLVPKDIKLKWTVYPSLIAVSEDDIVIRAKLSLISNPKGLALNEILQSNAFDKEYYGNNFIVDISMGTNIMDVNMDTDGYKAIRVFKEKE